MEDSPSCKTSVMVWRDVRCCVHPELQRSNLYAEQAPSKQVQL